MSSPNTEIYFFHIAKTAGSSLASLIRKAYPQDESIPVYECHQLFRLTREQINSYRCYTGHFGTGLDSLLDRDIPTVTILRDPFEQTFSHIRHAERPQANSHLLPRALRLGRRLWEGINIPRVRSFLADYYMSVGFKDFQTRNLGVSLDFTTNLGQKDNRYLQQLICQAEQGQSRDEILESAKRRLDSMAVVGTVERFSESVGLICDLIGIPAPPAPPEENVAPGRTARSRYRDSGEISPALAALIEQNTQYDQELYAYANKLLDQKLAQKKTNSTLVGV